MLKATRLAGGPMDNKWSSSFVYILASVGSAVGLGNVWRFPYLAGEFGGGAFLIVYLVCVGLLGAPLLLAESALGRIGDSNPLTTMRLLAEGHKGRLLWVAIGWFSIITPLVIFMFYSVVGGWTLQFALFFIEDENRVASAESARAAYSNMTGSPVRSILLTSTFGIATVAIVAAGFRQGLQRAVRYLVPMLFLFLLSLLIHTILTTDFLIGVAQLFHADFDKIGGKVWLVALGQAFFSLSIGVGASLAYGAYVPKQTRLASCIGAVVVADTSVALIAAMIIFPLAHTYGVSLAEGPGLVFVTLPVIFGQLPAGELFGIVFFALLFVAALTTSIAMLEPCIALLTEKTRLRRAAAASIVGVVVWAGSVPAALSFNILSSYYPLAAISAFHDFRIFDLMEFMTTTILVPATGLLIAIFTGWVIRKRDISPALDIRNQWILSSWRFSMRFMAPIGIFLVLLANFGLS